MMADPNPLRESVPPVGGKSPALGLSGLSLPRDGGLCPLVAWLLLPSLLLVPAPGRGDEVRVSHCFPGDSVTAIHDGIEPRTRVDRPRHSFWPHRGTREWVEWWFDAPRRVTATEVFWLDDTPDGDCPVPRSWRLLWRDGGTWREVSSPSGYGVERDVFNRVTFDPVETSALRIEVRSRPGRGSGIIEWDVRDDPERVRRRARRRLLARLRRIHLAPRQSRLLRTWQRTSGLSDAATGYLAGLEALRAEQNRLAVALEEGREVTPDDVGRVEQAVRSGLDRALRALGPIAFFTRQPLSRPNAVSCAIWQSRPEGWGCTIRVVEPGRGDGEVRTVFQDADASIFDMNPSLDGTRLLFSLARRGEPYWQLHEIGVDGSGLRRILPPVRAHDVGAIEVPGGDIVFVSTRRSGYTVCQPGPTSNLYRARHDGSGLRCVSQNTLADFSPQLLPDGRVLFTRWEYVDRDLTYRQSLWTQNPDGTRYQLYFGNTIRDVGTFWQARPLPGRSDLVLATFAPHHGWPHGAIGLIGVHAGPEAPRDVGFTYVTREYPRIEDRSWRWSYRDPYPVDDHLYLAAHGGDRRFSLWLLDICGNRVEVASDPGAGCYGPVLLGPAAGRASARPPSLVASTVGHGRDPRESGDPDEGPVRWGTLLLEDVAYGLEGIPRERMRYLRIMEQERKLHDLRRRAFDQSPVMGYGTYYAKRSWGLVELEPDGSAHFDVPALREIYLQVLDGEGREIRRMTSALQLMEGEVLGCIGCHEPRAWAPPASGRVPLAVRRPAVRPAPEPWGTDGLIDYPRLVQPVLDRWCVSCHHGSDPAGGYDLSGDRTRFFSMSYDHLLGRSRSYRQHDMLTGEMLAEDASRERPLVHYFWLLRTPSAVSRPMESGSLASRLPAYLDAEHCGREVPGEDRRRIYAWIDANVPFYATYRVSRSGSAGDRDLCWDPAAGGEARWFRDGFLEVYDRRCRECHGAFPDPNDHGRIWDGRFAWTNLTHPAWSSALTAHLSKDAGGRGLPTSGDDPDSLLFRTQEEPDFRRLLQALREGSALRTAFPRVDEPPTSPSAAGGS